MTVIAPGIRFLDLRFQGSPQVVATGVLEGPASRVALIDPGPTSTTASEGGLPAALGELKVPGVTSRGIGRLPSCTRHFPFGCRGVSS